MRIHTDHNGVAVNAIHQLADGTVVEGYVYQVLAGPNTTNLQFQMGLAKENGINGLTNEALLAVCEHRLKFLDAKFPCAENKEAITAIARAMDVLQQRTLDRQARGVEGLNVA